MKVLMQSEYRAEKLIGVLLQFLQVLTQSKPCFAIEQLVRTIANYGQAVEGCAGGSGRLAEYNSIKHEKRMTTKASSLRKVLRRSTH